MQHSDFDIPTEGTGTGTARALNADAIAAQAMAALNEGDHETAGKLLRDVEERFPDNNRLLRLATKQRRQAERFARVYSLLKETREAIEDDRFVQAMGAFREAANLSFGFAGLEEATFNAAVEESEALGPRNWRVAGALLEDVARLNSKLVVPAHLWEEVRAAEREENIANVLAETALAKPGELQRARERLHKMLQRYPEDSGLSNRLKSIDATIAEKRKWDERQRCLKKLTDLRDALQLVEDPAEAGKFVRLSETQASPFIAEPEFSSVVEDVRHQVISAERAAAALAQDRIDDCLEECAWVLSRMRHHQLFLRLKEKAEARELALVDEYSKSAARIRELLSAGQLAEAERLCAQASARLPQFEDLQELAREIAQHKAEQSKETRENIDSAQRLLERAERSLGERQFRAAEQYFGNALKLLPNDRVLASQAIAILHGAARSTATENAETAAEMLKMAERILPGTPVPSDLSELLRQQREKAKAQEIRWSALNKIEAIDAQVQPAKKRAQVIALGTELAERKFTDSGHADVKEAAAVLSGKIYAKIAALDQKRARRPVVLQAISLAATLILVAGLVFWLKTRGAEMVRPKLATVQIVKLTKSASEANLPPKLASVEIHGDESYTAIKLDGVIVASVGKNQILTQELPPGNHSIELSSNGYLPKIVNRQFSPGEKLVLTKEDLRLQSSDASMLASAQRSLNELKNKPSWAVVQGSAPKEKKAAVTPLLQAKAEQPRAAQATERNNPPSVQPLVEKNSPSPKPGNEKEAPEPVLLAREGKAEDNDWDGADHGNKAALEDFLRRHPGGRHALAATSALADLERIRRAGEMQSAEEATWKKVSQRDATSLESYLRDYPGSRYRDEAEIALTAIRLSQASRNETAAVLTVISRFANAWTAKDLDSILSIQRNLNRRAVKAELSQVKELDMRISPASTPQIEGSQAVVLCRRQAMQVFSDGTRKQIPEAVVSYVLAKHDGAWTIEETR